MAPDPNQPRITFLGLIESHVFCSLSCIYVYMELYTTDQIAEKIHMSTNFVRKLVKTGQIKAIKVGKGYLISEDAFNEFLKQNEK